MLEIQLVSEKISYHEINSEYENKNMEYEDKKTKESEIISSYIVGTIIEAALQQIGKVS